VENLQQIGPSGLSGITSLMSLEAAFPTLSGDALARGGLSSFSGQIRYDISSKLSLRADYDRIMRPRDMFSSYYLGETYQKTSLGVAYPVSSRLTLNGAYAVINTSSYDAVPGGGDVGGRGRGVPSLGTTYTFGANTSITVNYNRVGGLRQDGSVAVPGQNQTTAELKINF
ncbi:MAG: hypothetical protein HYU64_11915, partial [Armatimonadetes bacterium]|nr:hypothetical protein [Armatimonadota bacterium]